MRAFSRYMAPIIDKVLGLRCASYGYQYGEIAGSLASVRWRGKLQNVVYITICCGF